MQTKTKNLRFLSKVFNIRPNEWRNISIAWLIRFLYKFGFVIGWSVLVVLFVSKYGISSLPYLFVLNAVFSIIGAFVYSILLDKVPNSHLMLGSIFISGVLLFISTILYDTNPVLFFAILIVNIAIFLNQFKIGLNAYTEELFDPLQSERTFPFIEASETISGILAGITVMFFSSSFEAHNFIYLWIASLFLIIPLILFSKSESESIPLIKSKIKRKFSIGFISKWKKEFHSKEFDFVKGLALIVFFQWLIFNLLEFQYTTAVYHNVSDVIVDAGSGFEHAFIHDLGTLFMVFSSSALLIQLIIGSRIIKSIGVVGTMILHCIVSLFSFFGLTVSFNFMTAVFVKNNYTMTNVLHTNAYHSSYYAIKDDSRPYVREFLEGFVRPLGAVFGTVTLLIVQFAFQGTALTLYVNFLLVLAVLIALFISFRQHKLYTITAAHDLIYSPNKIDRINAVDILAQKGHKYSLRYYKKILLDKEESISLRVRILKALKELNNSNSIDYILKCLEFDQKAIKLQALDTLSSFKILGKLDSESIYLKYQVINSLKKLYKNEKSDEVISRIIEVMSKISGISTIEFLLNVLKRIHGEGKIEAIKAIGDYGDINLMSHVRPFLKSRSLRERAVAIVVLSKFDDYEKEANSQLREFLNSKGKKYISSSLFIIGELKLRNKKQFCLKYLKSKNLNIKINSAIALAKMGYEECVSNIVNLLFNEDVAIAKKVYKEILKVDVRIAKKIASIVKVSVEEKINDILSEESSKLLDSFSEENLLKLKWFYRLVEEYEEVELINNIIKSNNN